MGYSDSLFMYMLQYMQFYLASLHTPVKVAGFCDEKNITSQICFSTFNVTYQPTTTVQ